MNLLDELVAAMRVDWKRRIEDIRMGNMTAEALVQAAYE